MQTPSYQSVIFADLAVLVLLIKLRPDHALIQSTFSLFITLLVITIAPLFAWKVVLWPKFFSPLRNLPSPPGGTFFNGQLWTILKEDTGVPMKRWMEEVPNDGLIKYTHLLNKERILPTSPEALKEILVTKNYEFPKPKFVRESLTTLIGEGIIVAEGDEHKRQRRLLNPAFGYRHVKDLYPVFWDKASEVVAAMSEAISASSDQVVSVHNWASRATLDIIGVAGMDQDFGAIQNDLSPLKIAYNRIFEMSITRPHIIVQLVFVLLGPKFMESIPLKSNRATFQSRNEIRQVARDLIKQKQKKLEKGVVGKDILSVALQSGGFTDEELVDQLMTFLAAGHETTATSMMWACYYLCKHPDIQEKLREEIRDRLPSPQSGSKISDDEIDKMSYLNAFCKEVLRIAPPVRNTVRVAAQDTTVVGHMIPKGTAVMLPPAAINLNPALWGADAAEFKPERWLEEGKADKEPRSNYAFLTFLQGPRSCIGEKFAMAEFAILIAAWIGRFSMEFDGEYKLTIGGRVTSKPKNLNARLKIVDGW